jgi:pimeloyl-ACP methyl ester carboxylesterase
MKISLKIFTGLIILLVIIGGLLFVFQEKMIFFPQKLDKEYQFNFNQKFEEINIKINDGVSLNGLLFKADSTKGLIFYLHGNARSLKDWGLVAETYTSLNYDIFIPDYRGFGKSEGAIKNQRQIFNDVQIAYDEMLKSYQENKIIVLGYSIGTGPAAKIAATNKPELLILQAPYYNLTDLMEHAFPIIPTFILKYKFETEKYIKDCKMPVVIFHGDQDEVIYYGSSLKLKEHFKKQDTLITLKGQGHNGMTYNPDYKINLKMLLNRE